VVRAVNSTTGVALVEVCTLRTAKSLTGRASLS
jgi:hypothetical protein